MDDESVKFLAEWMTNLPNPLKEIPLINLAIPGSHDSMSYGIKPGADIAPDAISIVSHLYRVIPCVVRRWAMTQSLNAVDQLTYGIRYFDLRISRNPKDNHFYFVHGLYCEKITDPLSQFRKFMDDHPNEFVVFDCQHFYNFADGDYKRLETIFRTMFRDKFYTRSDGKLIDMTLNTTIALKRQLLVIYRYSIVPDVFWPSEEWPTPWPNQFKVKKLEMSLETNIRHRTPDTGYVTQCVLTPPVRFIVPRFYSSLRAQCATPVVRTLTKWIEEQSCGPFSMDSDKPTFNVFIADFIELNNFEFCRAVISLNDKLCTCIKQNDN